MIQRETISDWVNLFHDGAINIMSPDLVPTETDQQFDFKTVLQPDADVVMIIREDLLHPENEQALREGMRTHLEKVEARSDSLAGLQTLLKGSRWLSLLPVGWLGLNYWMKEGELMLWEYIYPTLIALFFAGIKRLIIAAMKWFIRYKLSGL